MKYAWIIFGWICVGLGFLGVFLPLLPTVVFLLMAAYAFSKSSPRFHAWLLDHPRFGFLIRDWQERGAIGRRSKITAVLAIIVSFIIVLLTVSNTYVVIFISVILSTVILYITTRP